jgi:hypothetical protein
MEWGKSGLTGDGLEHGLLRRLPGVPAAGAAAQVGATAAAWRPRRRGSGREAVERVGEEQRAGRK